jgi:CheY-like chemotaxis protein
MTAHARPQDKEQCIAVGMNDHISKPINIDELYMKLQIYLKKKDILFDEAVAMENIGQKLYNKVMLEFCNDYENINEKLIGFTDEEKLRFVHSLKSNLLTIGSLYHEDAKLLELEMIDKVYNTDHILNLEAKVNNLILHIKGIIK